ncbi:hypothetical protein [Citrobacter sp. Marseille-Q6884]
MTSAACKHRATVCSAKLTLIGN